MSKKVFSNSLPEFLIRRNVQRQVPGVTITVRTKGKNALKSQFTGERLSWSQVKKGACALENPTLTLGAS